MTYLEHLREGYFVRNLLTKDVADAKLQDAADVKTLTSSKKKSWLNGFKWGAIAGVTLGIIVRR